MCKDKPWWEDVDDWLIPNVFAEEYEDPSPEEPTSRPAEAWWPEWVEDRVPTYGHYGGPGHGDPTFKTKPIDEVDAYFREHDRGWASGRGEEADIELYKRLKNLPPDPKKWIPPAPDSKEAKSYRKKAQAYFRSRYDYLRTKEGVKRTKEAVNRKIRDIKRKIRDLF